MTNQDHNAPRRGSAAHLVAPTVKLMSAHVDADAVGAPHGENLIDGLPLDAWEDLWKPLSGGFQNRQRHLRDKIGLFAATRGEEYFYIGRAANMQGDGLAGGLQRVRGKNASGDKGWGMKLLKLNWQDLNAEVIALERSAKNIAVVQELYEAMLRSHRPVYNRPPGVVSSAIAATYKAAG